MDQWSASTEEAAWESIECQAFQVILENFLIWQLNSLFALRSFVSLMTKSLTADALMTYLSSDLHIYKRQPSADRNPSCYHFGFHLRPSSLREINPCIKALLQSISTCFCTVEHEPMFSSSNEMWMCNGKGVHLFNCRKSDDTVVLQVLTTCTQLSQWPREQWRAQIHLSVSSLWSRWFSLVCFPCMGLRWRCWRC